MKKKLRITYAGHLSDRVKDLYYRKVNPEGIDLDFQPLKPLEALNRALQGEFEAAEISFAAYVLLMARKESPFIAIPVFPLRAFQHHSIYVHTNSGIQHPRDLIGKRAGVSDDQMTEAIWVRGLLQDEYQVQPTELNWMTVQTPDRILDDLLQSGEIDALISSEPPTAFEQEGSGIIRLFQEYEEQEKQYYSKAKLFPITNVVVMHKNIYDQFPWAAVSLFEAFTEAKNRCLNLLSSVEEPLPISLPWFYSEFKSWEALMGKDLWPYGIERNVKEIETFCRYIDQQGLASEKLDKEELFAESVISLKYSKL